MWPRAASLSRLTGCPDSTAACRWNDVAASCIAEPAARLPGFDSRGDQPDAKPRTAMCVGERAALCMTVLVFVRT